ncbi:hypothetical protein C808_02625 [Lachnospiraceae bacterium M18-1]|nr:hypothetical protein C808_02625 [Lachnospiraceae bacterium M18-1]
MRNIKMKEEEMREIFSANLAYLRKSDRWRLSQKTLAKILHVPRKAIVNYESGKVLPPTYITYRMAVYFCCTMEDLLTEKLF